MAIFYAPAVHDNEMTPQIAVAFIAVFVVPALELVLLAGVGARKLYRAM
jgi:hypothetical protein